MKTILSTKPGKLEIMAFLELVAILLGEHEHDRKRNTNQILINNRVNMKTFTFTTENIIIRLIVKVTRNWCAPEFDMNTLSSKQMEDLGGSNSDVLLKNKTVRATNVIWVEWNKINFTNVCINITQTV
jgi:hypothetical protein